MTAKFKKAGKAKNDLRKGSRTKKKAGQTKAKGGPRGQADPLRGEAWNEWLEHVKKHGGAAWLYPLFVLMHALCFRVGQALILRGDDFEPGLRKAWAVPFKHRKKGEYKTILSGARPHVKQLKESGHSTEVRINQRKTKTVYWKWNKGLLFPATKATAKHEAMDRKTVARAINRAVKSFDSSRKDVVVSAIRSHSAKHHFINEGKRQGVPDAALQAYAEIKDPDIYHNIYGPMSMRQAGVVISRNKAFTKIVAKSL